MQDKTISLYVAVRWLAKVAASDGAITPSARKVSSEFANACGLDHAKIIGLAYGLSNDFEQEVEVTDTNEIKGRHFEQFVVSLCSDKSRYKLLAWRGYKISGSTYAAETLLPDLHLCHRLDAVEVEYPVECKYHSSCGEDGIDLYSQYMRYNFAAKDCGKLGIGGTLSNPDEFYMVPGCMVKLNKNIDRDRFIKCGCSRNSDGFNKYINHYFDKRIFKTLKPFFYVLVALLLLLPFTAIAQDKSITTEDIIRYYPYASPEDKVAIDSLFSDLTEKQKAVQVTSICGVPFGSSRSESAYILRNKFGEPNGFSNDTHIVYNNVTYAGMSFDSIHFLFQSDGYNSYFYTCIFIIEAKNKSKANEIMNLYKNLLGKKYDPLSEDIDALGFKNYGGGVSPLWNGNWYEFMTKLSDGIYLTAVHTDVIEYDDNIVRDFGNKYGVRIIYGPFQYVNEEF